MALATIGPRPASARTTFAVGRANRTATEVRIVTEHPSPFVGPWRLCGVVRRPMVTPAYPETGFGAPLG